MHKIYCEPIYDARSTVYKKNFKDMPTTFKHMHTHTHTSLTALFPGLPGYAGTRKAKPIRILLNQETVSGCGISWAICKSAPCSRLLSFLQAGCPSCRPTNSVKALKAYARMHTTLIMSN